MPKVPKIAMTVPHQLSQEEALQRIKRLLDDVKAEHPDTFSDLQETWSEHGGQFSAKIMGFPVSGELDVTPSEVRLSGNLPFAAMPFRGRIEDTVRQEAERLLR